MLRLKELRERKNVTQQDVADALDIDRSLYARYEYGTRTPPLDNLIKMAKYYEVTTDYMLGLTDDPQFEQPLTIAARPTAGMPPISEERLNEIIAQAVKAIRAEAAKNEKKPGK